MHGPTRAPGRVQTSAEVNLIQIDSLDPNVPRAKIHPQFTKKNPISCTTLCKKAVSRNAEESVKTFLELKPEADDFQNLISCSSSKDTSLVKFSSAVFTSRCYRRDRQTNARWNITSSVRVITGSINCIVWPIHQIYQQLMDHLANPTGTDAHVYMQSPTAELEKIRISM